MNRRAVRHPTRESVADAIGVHPNSLAALCKQVSGENFEDTFPYNERAFVDSQRGKS